MAPASHLPSNPTPPGSHRAQGVSSLSYVTNPHWLYTLHMVVYIDEWRTRHGSSFLHGQQQLKNLPAQSSLVTS